MTPTVKLGARRYNKASHTSALSSSQLFLNTTGGDQMPKNKFGNLRTRVVGNIAGIPLVAINTIPMMIDDCPVLINFAQGEERTSSSELKLGAVEQALRATYEPGTLPAPETTEQDSVPVSRIKHVAPTADADEFKQLLAEGVAVFKKENLSVDL